MVFAFALMIYTAYAYAP